MPVTNEEINEAIRSLIKPESSGWECAKCGEINIPWTHVSYEETHDACGGTCIVKDEPNYAESLDACAGFERTLDRIQRREYVRGLYAITANDFEAHCATSLVRCEAYLRMKGLWNE